MMKLSELLDEVQEAEERQEITKDSPETAHCTGELPTPQGPTEDTISSEEHQSQSQLYYRHPSHDRFPVLLFL
jgi:hypothetical protein